MAQVTNEGKSNSLDVELNLVPFIDLLSTLVLFLLLSAAWLHVSAIQTSVASKGPNRAVVVQERRLEVRVTGAGYQLRWPAGFGGMPASVPGGEAFRGLAAKAAEKGLKLASVTADDGVEYGKLIEAIDLAKAAGVPVVALGVN